MASIGGGFTFKFTSEEAFLPGGHLRAYATVPRAR